MYIKTLHYKKKAGSLKKSASELRTTRPFFLSLIMLVFVFMHVVWNRYVYRYAYCIYMYMYVLCQYYIEQLLLHT